MRILGPTGSNQGTSYAYKVIRKTTGEEQFDIKYNVSGSASVRILSAPNSSSLKQGINLPFSDENIREVYRKDYDNFDPYYYNYSIVDGETITSQSYDLTNSSGSQIIQDTFIVPENEWFAIYLKNEDQSCANNLCTENSSSWFSNVSVRHSEINGVNQNYFHKELEIFGAARREEQLQFKVRYLNPNMEPCRDFRTTDGYIFSSQSLDYKPEGVWIERGLGKGIQSQDTPAFDINLGARYTTVASQSADYTDNLNTVKDKITVGVIGESSNFDDWDVLKDVYPGSSSMNLNVELNTAHSDADFSLTTPVGRSVNIGGYFNSSRKQLYTPQLPAANKYLQHRVIGISAEAWDSNTHPYTSDSGTSSVDVWAARFEHGDVFINNRLGIGIPKNQVRPNKALHVVGDIEIEGNITASSYLVNTEVVSQSIIFESGSTAFGDTFDDTHTFTGSMYVDGDIYSNGILINSESYWIKEPLGSGKFRITSSNPIFVRGTVSASSNVIGGNLLGSGYVQGTRFKSTNTETTSSFGNISGSRELYLEGSASFGTSESSFVGINPNIPTRGIYASGSISSSANLYGYDIHSANGIYIPNNKFLYLGDSSGNDRAFLYRSTTNLIGIGDSTITAYQISLNGGPMLYITGSGSNIGRVGIGTSAPSKYLTVAGDISASGTLYVSSSHGDPSNLILTYNTSSGEVHYTSSLALYPDGGGGGGSGTVTSIVSGDGLNGGTITSTGTISVDSASMGGFYSASMNNFSTAGSGSFGGASATSGKTLTVTGDISASGDIWLEDGKKINWINSGQNIYGTEYAINIDGDDYINLTADNRVDVVAPELRVTGTISGSSYLDIETVSASNSVVINASTGSQSQLTVGGSVSASGDLYIGNVDGGGEGTGGPNQILIGSGQSGPSGSIKFQSANASHTIRHAKDVNSGALTFTGNDGTDIVFIGSTGTADKTLTVYGDISASGDFYSGTTKLLLSSETGSFLTTVDISSNTNLAGGTGITLTGDTLSTTDSEIVHDSLSGFVGDEHIDHTSVTMTAGAGLSGGGTIAATRTFSVDSASMGGFYSASMNDFTTTGFIKGNHITASGNISSSGTLLGNSLTLGGTAITSTATELNKMDGGTVASNITPQDADRVVYNDDGVMKQVTMTKLASYFDDEITNMPNLADIGTDLTVAGNITASGNISSSGTVIGSNLSGTNTGDITLAGTPDYITISNQVITRNTIDIGDDTNLVGGTGITLTGDTLSTTDGEIVHDSLSGFVGDEHIDHSGVTLTAGAGLNGGGDITANRIFSVDSASMGSFYSASMDSFTTTGTGSFGYVSVSSDIDVAGNITASNLTANTNISASGDIFGKTMVINASTGSSAQLTVGGSVSASGDLFVDDITADQIAGTITTATQGTINHDSLAGFVANEHIDHSAVSIASGTGLSGGGTIASTRTLSVDAVQTQITDVGALDEGSITSGFGTINNGASAITTTGTGSFGYVSVSSDIDVAGNVTASNLTANTTISSSGDIFGKTMVINASTGSSAQLTVGGAISASGDISGSKLHLAKTGASANEKLLTITEDGTERFYVDEDGDIYGRSLNLDFGTIGLDGTSRISLDTADIMFTNDNGQVTIYNPDTSIVEDQVIGKIRVTDADTVFATAAVIFRATQDHNEEDAGGTKIEFNAYNNTDDATNDIDYQDADWNIVTIDPNGTNGHLHVRGNISSSGYFDIGTVSASNSVVINAPTGSSAQLTIGGSVSASGIFYGDGSGLSNVSATLDIDGLGALGGTGLHQTDDHFVFSDDGTEKKITFSNLEDAIFGNISGDATVAAGGALTIAGTSVENSMLVNDGITIAGADTSLGGSITADTIAGQISVDTISGNQINGGTIGSVTISQLGGALDVNNENITNIDVDSGTIDGTVIGGASAAAGTFTSVSATSISGSSVLIEGHSQDIRTYAFSNSQPYQLDLTSGTGDDRVMSWMSSGQGGEVAISGSLQIGKNVGTNFTVPVTGLAVEGTVSASGDLFVGSANTGGTYVSASNGNIEMNGADNALLQVDGNISASGKIDGKIKHITHHAFYGHASTKIAVPGPFSTNESTAPQGYSFMIAPFSGSLQKVIMYNQTTDPGATTVGFVTGSFNSVGNSDDELDFDYPKQEISQDMVDDTNTLYRFSGSVATFEAGDRIGITVDAASSNNNWWNLTAVWEYDTNEEGNF